jgi:membrane protease YdiL (CAAX protease family)
VPYCTSRSAIIVSALCFGVYHWFTWQAFGNAMQMLIILITTGSMGLILAFAFVRTQSIIAPFALHLGANLSTMLIFSKDASIGPQMLIKTFAKDPVVPGDLISLPIILMHFAGYPCTTLALIYWYTRNRQKNRKGDTKFALRL